ncbi:MAG: AEC family transporter [Anaerolineae bacterium]|nr:AEC family transporter [Anaerolineae bacterium]
MQIFEIIFPVFAISLVGYVLARRHFFQETHIIGLSRFVFHIAIPVLLFESLATIELPTQVNWQFLLCYYLVVVAIYGVSMWIGRVRFTYSAREQGVFGMGAAYSNLVLVGLPIVTAAFGDAALLPMFMIISIHSGVLFFIGTVMAERESSQGLAVTAVARQTINQLARNPIISSLLLGLLFNALALPMPGLLATTLDVLGQAALPCALIVLGASLSYFKPAGHLTAAWTMVGLKIIVQPVLVWLLAFHVFHLESLWGTIAVLAAGMPVGINAYMFAQKYEVCIAPLATAVLLSTFLSVGSLSFWLALFLS